VATKSGTFTTSNAPTNEFVGWVSQLASNPYELNQISSTIPSASVWLNAYCQVEVSDSWVGSSFYPTVQFGQGGFLPGVATSSSGAYTLGFPEYFQYTVVATGNYNLPVTVTLTLSSTGTCTTSDSESGDNWMGQPTSASNSHYLMEANIDGNWNATEWVSSSLSASNDYRQFGLEPNGVDFAASTVAFVHTSYADCSVSIQSGFTQNVQAYVAGNGNTDQATGGNYGSVDGGPGHESAINYHYSTTGTMNETSIPTVVNTYAIGNPYGPELNGVVYPDPLASPPAKDGSHTITVGYNTQNNYGWYNGGSNTSTSGLDITVDLSGGYDGFSIGASFPLIYTTTMGSSVTKSISCTFTGFTKTQNIQFYFWQDGGTPSNQLAVICTSGTTTCARSTPVDAQNEQTVLPLRWNPVRATAGEG